MNIRSVLPFFCVLLVSCATTEQSGFITVSSQPAIVGDAGTAARAYHDSAAYQRGLQVVADQAASWIKERAPGAQRPALVLDIDETASPKRNSCFLILFIESRSWAWQV
jgi:hypothetical protein